MQYSNFPSQNSNGSHFYTKSEFDFVASDVSYNSLVNEAVHVMQISPEMLDQHVQMFTQSVNRDPNIFRVPNDGGDVFFKKLNLGLVIVNLSNAAARSSLKSRSDQVLRWIVDGFASILPGAAVPADELLAFNNARSKLLTKPFLGVTKTLAETSEAINLIPDKDLYNAVVQIANGYGTDRGTAIAAAGATGNILGTYLPLMPKAKIGAEIFDNSQPSPWLVGGTGLDLLNVWVTNVYPALNKEKAMINPNQFRMNGAPRQSVGGSADRILINIGEKLSTDAFFRERNFREVLQEVGVSMDQFEKLIENSMDVIYWPDCVSSKLDDASIRLLIKGLGLGHENLESMSKMEMCSYILQALGYTSARMKDGTFDWSTIIKDDKLIKLHQIVAAIRRPGLGEIPAGYLGAHEKELKFSNGLPPGNKGVTVGAYALTGFSAHNVTMDKATKWLQATGVDAATQISFTSYAQNQNVFDMLPARNRARNIDFSSQMDYTKDMLDSRIVRNGAIGIWNS